ncbi:trypsin-like peptidase domain-containing protein [Candidatus Woesearchaeota archaeon]|nr:trypsin-like peptidase domain-containing protein [Candidatus Woesearchaeota archaeon]
MRRRTLQHLLIVFSVVLAFSFAFNAYVFYSFEERFSSLNHQEVVRPEFTGLVDSAAFERVASKVTPSVVAIEAGDSQGSGIVYRDDGIILTNFHVINNANNTRAPIRVTLPDKRIFRAEVIGTDQLTDVALLRVNATDLPVAQFGDSDALRVGEPIVAIGSPFGFTSTVTTGVISAKHRNAGPTEYRDYLQVDASINPGNSGGPLVNLKGEVVGLNTFIVSSQVAGELGFAIPSNLFQEIIERLLNDGKVVRGYLGVQVRDDIRFDENGNGHILNGSLVTGLLEDGPSSKAGLKIGDLIIDLNNETIDSSNTLRNVVALISPGDGVLVTVLRNETRRDFVVKLAERPES